ncbi:TetR/AcrR family transcriptional regulator [Rugosimonospora africana]|uniref:TetR family transcriptional regulator n=1 Tax=Rugosimonospora africana TaxID=556532 RepID=A0A8J3QYE8_9ACTN|nr:TetR/AcrR family transcriptional regulator [Rugosimonospora africana]GIH19173.1 TetR family transcriptional regulator [Rugosimonospora africana]
MAERTVRADARRNRAVLLQAAAEAFATGGLGVPLDEIARRAGVGAGTLYRHFPTKEALFEAVVHDRMQNLIEAAQALRKADDAGPALFELLDRLVAEAGPKKDLVDALVGAQVDVHARLGGMGAQLREEIQHLLTAAQRQHAVRADITVGDLMALISGLLLALHGNGNHHAADPQRMLAVLRDGLSAVR